MLARHVLDVGAEPGDPVEPDDGHALEEGDVHQRDGGRVIIHDLKVVYSTLNSINDYVNYIFLM